MEVMMKQLIKKMVPEAAKNKIRQTRQYNKMIAKRLACTSKRIDICATQFAHYLHLSNHPPISNKICLEIGSGWVLSHAIICYLLGARKVFATDIHHCGHPEVLNKAIHESIAYIPRDILSPFAEHSLIRKRFDNLLSIDHFNFEVLRKLGIEYIAPIDFVKDTLNVPIDFIYSISVLEHVFCDDIPLLLKNIVLHLKPGGTMLHVVHLEDHKDWDNSPFDFLSISSDEYSRSFQATRGNRIRSSHWQELFGALENTNSKIIYKWTRKDKELPAHIDQSINYKDKADLRVSHIGLYTWKHT